MVVREAIFARPAGRGWHTAMRISSTGARGAGVNLLASAVASQPALR